MLRSSLLVSAIALAACGGPPRPAARTPGTPAGASAAPRLLVTLPAIEQTVAPPFLLAADTRHLAWTSRDGIVLADADGRAPKVLVRDVYATALALDGDRLRYRALEAGADERDWVVPLAGGRPEPDPHPAPAPTAAAAADDDGSVRVSDSRGEVRIASAAALVVDDRSGGPPRALTPPAGGGGWLEQPPALLADAIIAADVDVDGDLRLWRLPRAQADAPVLLGTSDGSPRELAAVGGALYFVEESQDEPTDLGAPSVDRLVRLDAGGHRTSVLATPGLVTLAADPRGVAYATTDDEQRATIWLAEPGAPARRVVDGIDDELVGLALSPRSIFWIAGGTIWTASRTGGRPTRFHHPEWGDAGGNGRAHLVIDGSTVYFSSVGLGATGVFRTRGGFESTELWPPPEEGMADELVQVGGALFAIVGHSAIWRIPMDGGAPSALYDAGERPIVTIAGGGGWLYAAVGGAGDSDLVALDPATGAPAATLHTIVTLSALAADDGAVYFVHDDDGWILRAPHPPHAP